MFPINVSTRKAVENYYWVSYAYPSPVSSAVQTNSQHVF